MNRKCPREFDHMASTDDAVRYAALKSILKKTEAPVDWAYEVWDSLAERLRDPNSYQRSIAAMVLCNLAKSDPKLRMRKTAADLLPLMRDEKFITSRQCIQGIWKLVAVDPRAGKQVVEALVRRFDECRKEKHYNLIRQDVIQSLGKAGTEAGDPSLREKALALIETEPEQKYRKQYLAALMAT